MSLPTSSSNVLRNLLKWIYCKPIVWLTQHSAVKYQTLFFTCAVNIHFRTRQNYDRVYGNRRGASDTAESESAHEEGHSREGQLVIDVERGHDDECPEAKSAHYKYPRHNELAWRHFPEFPPQFVTFRRFTTIWMCYVVLKYLTLDIYRDRLYGTLKIPFEIDCLLLGRFIIDEKFATFVGFIMCSLHLFWRIRVSLRRLPYKLSAMYFLLLSPDDIKLLHSRLRNHTANRNQAIRPTNATRFHSYMELTPREVDHLTGRELLLLETMCFRIDTLRAVYYLLRPNRTAAANLRLRKLLANFFYFSAITCTAIGLWIVAFGVTNILLDSRYLRVYHQCDAHLQYLNDTNQLAEWSMTLTWHHALSGLVDGIENWVIWLEGGLVLVFGSSFSCLLNYDLLLYWRPIDRRIRRLQRRAKGELIMDSVGLNEHQEDPQDRSSQTKDDIVELQHEMMDFFAEVRRTDLFIRDALRISLLGGLYFSASFTYFTQVESVHLPTGIIVLLAFISAIIFGICFSFINLHRLCIKSYPSFCSLIAHDRSATKRKFGLIMEMYLQKRTCYTLFQHYPFLATTFITIISYSFSCFFLISGLLKQKHFQACVRQHSREYCSAEI